MKAKIFGVWKLLKQLGTKTGALPRAEAAGLMRDEGRTFNARLSTLNAQVRNGDTLKRELRTGMRAVGVACAFMMVFALGVAASGAATNDVSGLLQKGLFEEEANHNLDAAIQAYQAVVTQTDKNHQFAATAIFRLAECYRKQGKTNEANVQYQRIVREFPDQAELAKLSRAQLGVAPDAPQNGADNPDQIALLKQMSVEKRRTAAQQMFPSPVLNVLVQRMTEMEQQLAGSKSTYGNQHPEVTGKEAMLKSIYQQIDDQVEGILAGRAHVTGGWEMLASQNKTPINSEPSPGREKEQKAVEEESEIKKIQMTIKDSPDLINANTGGETLLYRAVVRKQPAVVKFLLDNKADIEPRDSYGRTPLLVAAELGDVPMVELLLSHGADVNAVATRNERNSALHYAAQQGYKAIAETLLAHGAKADIRDSIGRTPLTVAAYKGFKTLAETLVAKGADINAKDNSGQTPLFSAVKAANKSIAEWLLATGADVKAANLEGKSVLFAAVGTGNKAIVELLLANKADVNQKAPNGNAPLLEAVNEQKLEIARLFLEHGANVNAKLIAVNDSIGGWTALHAAASQNPGNVEMVKLLLEFHADPNVGLGVKNPYSESGTTPLMLAIYQSQKEIVQLLLANKADPNLRNSAGQTALFGAYHLKKQDVAALLLESNADIDLKYSHAKTLLLIAVENGENFFAQLLLKHGAKINIQDDNGQTALHLAAKGLAPKTVELLLTYGADVNIKDNNGNTPLDLVPKTERGQTLVGADEIIAALRQHGGVAEVDLATIRYLRSGKPLKIIFRKDPGSVNQFTLFEFIAHMYDTEMTPTVFEPIHGQRAYLAETNLNFPDFSRIKIIHLAKQGKTNIDRVDLNRPLLQGDCSPNSILKWGDIVEIPEADHIVTEKFSGLTPPLADTLAKCLTRQVEIVVKGQSTKITLRPSIYSTSAVPNYSPLRSAPTESAKPKTELSNFWLGQVVHSANVLLASSDLTRVKVRRADSATGKNRELIFDLEKTDHNADFWLEDGDVIELPEKSGE